MVTTGSPVAASLYTSVHEVCLVVLACMQRIAVSNTHAVRGASSAMWHLQRAARATHHLEPRSCQGSEGAGPCHLSALVGCLGHAVVLVPARHSCQCLQCCHTGGKEWEAERVLVTYCRKQPVTLSMWNTSMLPSCTHTPHTALCSSKPSQEK